MKLTIHIGGSKCGSTTIQRDLSLNWRTLEKERICVPSHNLDTESESRGEQIWFFESKREDIEAGRLQTLAQLEKIKASEKYDHVIVSAENLCNPTGLEGCFIGLDDIWDVSVLFYIRRQDDFISSAWQQWHLKTHKDFWGWYTRVAGSVANWQGYLQPWLNQFGKDKISVRLFDRDWLLNRDILSDYRTQLGIDQLQMQKVGSDANRSFNMSVQDLCLQANELFDGAHDNRLYAMIADLTGNRHLKRRNECRATVHFVRKATPRFTRCQQP